MRNLFLYCKTIYCTFVLKIIQLIYLKNSFKKTHISITYVLSKSNKMKKSLKFSLGCAP